jgi:hypothetical protein
VEFCVRVSETFGLVHPVHIILFLAGLLAVERTTTLQQSDRSFRPLCSAQPGNKMHSLYHLRCNGLLPVPLLFYGDINQSASELYYTAL